MQNYIIRQYASQGISGHYTHCISSKCKKVPNNHKASKIVRPYRQNMQVFKGVKKEKKSKPWGRARMPMIPNVLTETKVPQPSEVHTVKATK